MKKILFVMLSLYNGGAEKSLVNLLNELPADKYEIDLLLFRREGTFLCQVPNWVNVLEPIKSLQNKYGSLCQLGFSALWKIVVDLYSRIFTKSRSEKRGYRWNKFFGPSIEKLPGHYDIAIAYSSGEIMYFVDEKVDADKKVVWIHNDYKTANYSKKYDYEHLKNMNAVVTISKECADVLNVEFPDFVNKTYMIENITSSEVIRRRALEFFPKEFNKDREEQIILSIGRLDYQKGFDFAIEAAAVLKAKGIKFKWFIIGSGALEKDLKKLIKSNQLEDYVILLGIRENPYPYILNCDLIVQSSRYEGKSVVLDEAKILSKPIVVTNYPTVKDQISDKKEGIIVDMTPQAIANGIEVMMKNDDLRDAIHNYLASREYGNQQEVQKYISLIDNL